MARRWVVAGSAALALLSSVGASADSQVLELRSTTAKHRHVVVTYTLDDPDLVPGSIVVARRATRNADGSFAAANIRLDEPLRPTRIRGDYYRARTQHTLAPGRYWVEISGVAIGVDCLPAKPCHQTWSNVRRVVVRRSE
jgi:hypothetical protein